MNLFSVWAGAKWAVDFKEFKTKGVAMEADVGVGARPRHRL